MNLKNISVLLFCLFHFSCSTSQNDSNNDIENIEEPNSSLILSDGTMFAQKDYYPNFNWNTTPMYFMFGQSSDVLSSEEAHSIAKQTDFICIEKNHAWETLKYAELGTKHEVAAFKAIKPDIKVLFYFNSAYAWRFTSYNQYFTQDKIDDHPILKSYLITNEDTGALEHRNNTFYFDVLNPDFRDWWVDTVSNGVKETGADGVFIDQMHGFVWLRSSRRNEVEEAMGKMMKNLKETMGADKILLGNNASEVEDVYPSIDVAMLEHYKADFLSKEKLLNDWGVMLKNAKAGKMTVFRVGVEVESGTEHLSTSELETLSKEKLEYYLACYLIGAQPYSYFQYGWGWQLHMGSLVDYPLLSHSLGKPLEAYKRVTEDGWGFTRNFEYAKVWVNTESKKAKIDWLSN